VFGGGGATPATDGGVLLPVALIVLSGVAVVPCEVGSTPVIAATPTALNTITAMAAPATKG